MTALAVALPQPGGQNCANFRLGMMQFRIASELGLGDGRLAFL